ncbi:unnamed protein product, partial [marine sediment metagenome]
GSKDRGGLQALLKLVQKTSFPIILTAMPIVNKSFM